MDSHGTSTPVDNLLKKMQNHPPNSGNVILTFFLPCFVDEPPILKQALDYP